MLKYKNQTQKGYLMVENQIKKRELLTEEVRLLLLEKMSKDKLSISHTSNCLGICRESLKRILRFDKEDPSKTKHLPRTKKLYQIKEFFSLK